MAEPTNIHHAYQRALKVLRKNTKPDQNEPGAFVVEPSIIDQILLVCTVWDKAPEEVIADLRKGL